MLGASLLGPAIGARSANPFLFLVWEGSKLLKNRLEKRKGYPYSNLCTGGPSLGFLGGNHIPTNPEPSVLGKLDTICV